MSGDNYKVRKKLRMNTWFRGDTCNFFPKPPAKYTVNWLLQNVIKGTSPPKPFITKEHYITAFGSCFAYHIKEHLRNEGFKVDPNDALVTRFGAGSVNVYTILQQFRWAYGLQDYDDELWIADKNVVAVHGDVSRKKARSVFDQTEVLILTFGLSEVWYNKETGGVFWRAVPHKLYDKEKHAFRYLTFDETKARLQEIIGTVRQCMGDIPVILTLSPIRLAATFRPISAVVANSSSKATLRAAINEVVDEADDKVFYWPSYDIIDLLPDPYREDGLHLKPAVIKKIMRCFQQEYTR